MFTLVLDPGGPAPRRIEFDVSDADVEDAVHYGRADRGDDPARQRDDAAYHAVMHGRFCGVDELHDRPWVLTRGERTIAHNAAVTVR